MKKETNLCMGCMNERQSHGVCPLCGYNDDSVYLSSYLAPSTYLARRYIIGKLLSYNGESAAYLAYDEMKREKVIIKEYMPDTLCRRKRDIPAMMVNQEEVPLYKTYLSEFIELHRSLMKAQSLTRLQVIYDIFTENNTAYIAFENIQGMQFKTYLSNLGGSMTWEQAKELFPPILTALSQIHEIGILHRGISPATVYVNEKSELKLTDFAITACRTRGSGLNYELFAGYSAPEQYLENERHGSWTDVYGISALLYKALTGQIPPDATERMEHDTLVRPMMINRNIPSTVSDAIYRGLAMDIGERIQTINEFVDRLFEQPSVGSNTVATERRKNVKKADTAKKKGNVSSKSRKEKKSSNAKVIFGLVCLGLIIIAFVVALVIALTDEKFNTKPEESAPSLIVTDMPEETTVTTTTSVTTASSEPVFDTYYKVPDFTNRLYDLIKDNSKYQFLQITTIYEFNADFADGYIFDQDVEADTEVPYGTAITLMISKGPSLIALPDYTGMQYTEYRDILSSLNIKYKRAAVATSNHEEGTVIGCSVSIGGEVDVENGEIITVYYAVADGSADLTSDGEEAAQTIPDFISDFLSTRDDTTEATQ